MATMVLNPLIEAFIGKSGNWVFYRRYNTQCMREKVKPRDPDTPGQRMNRQRFGDAVYSWQRLTIDEKNKFNRKSRKKNMSGYNLFISMFMRTGEEAKAASGLESIVISSLNKRDQLRTRSVSPPFLLHKGEETGIKPLFFIKRN